VKVNTPFESLVAQVGPHRNFDSPPLHLWHPQLNGDIAIRIDGRGAWYHEGGKIERESLVRLFASILRREEDGHYYLVTPIEKWRIQVEAHALLVTDIDVLIVEGVGMLQATLNTDRQVLVSEQYPLLPDPAMGGIAVLRLPHGLSALCTRPAWYRLVEMGESHSDSVTLRSGDFEFSLPVA
jgi:uncharacterized protein